MQQKNYLNSLHVKPVNVRVFVRVSIYNICWIERICDMTQEIHFLQKVIFVILLVLSTSTYFKVLQVYTSGHFY